MRAPSPRSRFLALVVAAALAPAATAQADLTEADLRAQALAPPACAAATTAGPGCRVLAEPGTPGDDVPAVPAALGSSGSPEDDLAAALQRLADSSDAAAAAAARDEALAILEGTPLPGRVYSGIPLLNWNAPAKVKTVPAGGTVEIREVRFPDHSLSDAWLLEFEDPTQPYTVRYRISELGGAVGGELAPVPLVADGEVRTGAVATEMVPLVPPELRTGTFDFSRFTIARGLIDGGHESSRVAEQVVELRMPAPGMTQAILQPNKRTNAPSLFTLQRATAERLAAAEAAFGFSGAEPTAAERAAAIERLAVAAPERQLWTDLRSLPAADDPGFLAAANSIGSQDGLLVDTMRTRGELPSDVGADADADLTLVLQNGETYVSRTRLRPAEPGRLRVRVVNRDGFAHGVSAVALHDRSAILGAVDWGRFAWTPLTGADVDARESATVDFDLPPTAFTLWLGDADTGDQAATMIQLDHGPRVSSVQPTDDVAAQPLHQAIDAAGDHWLTLSGADAVARLSPAADLEQSRRSVSLIPGGRHTADSPEAPLEPTDIAVDHRGVVWTTLSLGNAVARIDPALARDGTDAGVRVYDLPACGEDECPVVFPPEPGVRPTRQPLQMKVTQDAKGNTLVWFTEANVDRIGLLRVAPDGTQLGQTHFSCGCGAPLGIALDQAGDVWFTEGVTNRIGRLTLDTARPYAAAGATLRHYPIPGGVLVDEPELSPNPVATTLPHSLAIDRRGIVWFTQSATGRLGHVDPDLAVPGTSEGMDALRLPVTDFGTTPNPADLTVDRAGTVFWTDEYGDIVGTVDATGPRADWDVGRSFRPVARRSLTDSPLVDDAGDLWFLEAAAGRITRIAGVSAGNPAVAPRPEVDVDAAADTIAVAGLAEAATVDVRVERGGDDVVRVDDVDVRDGAAAVRDWGVADALRPGDVVAVHPHGEHLSATFSTRLPALTARAVAGGVEGEARLDGRPAAGLVVAAGGRQTDVDAVAGTFRLTGAADSVAWTAAKPGAVWRVHVAVTQAPVVEPTPTPQPPAADPTPAPTPRSQPQPTPKAEQPQSSARTPEPEAATSEAPQADPTPATDVTAPALAPVTRPETPDTAVPAPSTCPTHWLTSAGPAFVGRSAAAAEKCLGRPLSRRGGVRRYARGLSLEVRGGRVVRLAIDAAGWTSAGGGLTVGAAARTVRAALPTARRVGRSDVRRARVSLAGGRRADVRIAVRDGRVRRIDVRVVAARVGRAGT